MGLSDEIQTAIQAHAMWKINLLKALESGGTSLDPLDASKDQNCAFGKWLSGDTILPESKAMDEYSVCVRLHKEFHDTIGEILLLSQAGRRGEALKLLADDSLYSILSAALIQHMKLWRARWERNHPEWCK